MELEQSFDYEVDIFGVRVPQALGSYKANNLVDEANKIAYVRELYTAKIQKESEKQIKSFKQGLYEIVPEHALRFFSSGDLGILIAGKSEIDIEDLIKHATYKEYDSQSTQVCWLWDILKIMDHDMLSNLMFFITGILSLIEKNNGLYRIF